MISSEKEFTQDCDTAVAGKHKMYMGEPDSTSEFAENLKSNIMVDVR